MSARSLLVLGGVVLATTAAAESGRARSLAIYPAQLMPLEFKHSWHLVDRKTGKPTGVDCFACHDKARKSTQASDRLLPGSAKDPHEDCVNCHDIDAAQAGTAKPDDPPSTCVTCHVGFDEAMKSPVKVQYTRAHLVFSHKAHVDLKIKCEGCHSGMTDVSLGTTLQLPKMETCLVCHDNTYASAERKTCHLTSPSGRLQMTFTSGLLRPMQGNPYGLDHGPRYEFTHGTRAKLDRATCMSCHAESECLQCHDALQKPLSVHPNDYIALHPVEARMDTPKCDSCHRYQSFCAACHERAGVGLSAAAFFRAKNVRVHPDYTTWVTQPGPKHHGIEASRNIQECIGCHRQEDCLPCHSNQPQANDGIYKRYTLGRDPHPDGFKGICTQLYSRNPRPCLVCHAHASTEITSCGGT